MCTPLAPTRIKIIYKTACSNGPNSGSENLLKTGFAQKGLPVGWKDRPLAATALSALSESALLLFQSSHNWAVFRYFRCRCKSSNCCDFWTELGPRLFEALLPTRCLKKVFQNRTSKEALDSTCWGSSFGPPCVFEKGQKVDPLEIKSGASWRVQFCPLHCGKSVETFI